MESQNQLQNMTLAPCPSQILLFPGSAQAYLPALSEAWAGTFLPLGVRTVSIPFDELIGADAHIMISDSLYCGAFQDVWCLNK